MTKHLFYKSSNTTQLSNIGMLKLAMVKLSERVYLSFDNLTNNADSPYVRRALLYNMLDKVGITPNMNHTNKALEELLIRSVPYGQRAGLIRGTMADTRADSLNPKMHPNYRKPDFSTRRNTNVQPPKLPVIANIVDTLKSKPFAGGNTNVQPPKLPVIANIVDTLKSKPSAGGNTNVQPPKLPVIANIVDALKSKPSAGGKLLQVARRNPLISLLAGTAGIAGGYGLYNNNKDV